ncbi:HNH endonuclease [Mycobacterium intracellulare]|uniref:HNH endonuclease n=1 Tax=Mycobacterium intracellulare TaxID=1767 RepID=UPI001FF809DF|nr:HNH endonuclease [Mycobacterium intracellulare]
MLVLEAFKGPRPNGAVSCHNDGNLDNNREDNLRWDSQSSNNFDRVKHGRHPEAGKTSCKNDHPFDEANTYIHPVNGRRQCRACMRDIDARRGDKRVRINGKRIRVKG